MASSSPPPQASCDYGSAGYDDEYVQLAPLDVSDFLVDDDEIGQDGHPANAPLQSDAYLLQLVDQSLPNSSPTAGGAVRRAHGCVESREQKGCATAGKENKVVAFRTKSDKEVLDDGYRWRKYGKKPVKDSPNPRNYYRCSADGCRVKKRVERDRLDGSYVITSYQGKHNHDAPSPSLSLQQMGLATVSPRYGSCPYANGWQPSSCV